MAAVHRNTDDRTCGATTGVIGQDSVYANSLLISVDGDTNSHSGGALTAACNNVFVNNKMVVDKGDDAGADGLCPTAGGEHCSPNAKGASGNVFVGN